MSEPSTKPYLIRAIYDWCADAGYTPYLAVQVDEHTQVPMSYVRDGRIVLNVGAGAVHNLRIDNDAITCGARFGGVPYQIVVPIGAVIGIFAKETGQGLAFQEQSCSGEAGRGVHSSSGDSPPRNRPGLRIVK